MVWWAVGLAVYLGACFLLARSYLRPLRSVPGLPEGLIEVEVAASAGLTPAWATPRLGEGRALFVLAHGYGGRRDTWQDLMPRLDALGFDAVAPAMPGQDASPEPTVGFGVAESQLIADTVKWARTRYPKPPKVVLVGVSMGGAATWLATGKVDGVHAVATEGAYARFDEAMAGWFDHLFPGANVVLRPVVWFARLQSGLVPASIVPLDAAKAWKGKPALVIHGELDSLIPRSHADRLRQASGAELWVVPGAFHAQCMAEDLDGYVERLANLADRP